MNLEFLQKQWEAFLSAPVPTVLFLALGAIAAWWLRGAIDKGETEGLRGKVDALEERLRLAGDKAQLAAEAKERAEADVRRLREQFDAGASKQALETTFSSAQTNLALLTKWEQETIAVLGPDMAPSGSRSKTLDPTISGFAVELLKNEFKAAGKKHGDLDLSKCLGKYVAGFGLRVQDAGYSDDEKNIGSF
jgi:hypothetical protein